MKIAFAVAKCFLAALTLTSCAQSPSPSQAVAVLTETNEAESQTLTQGTPTELGPAFELPQSRLLIANWSNPEAPCYIVYLPDLTIEPYEALNTGPGVDRIDAVSPGGGFIAYINVDLDSGQAADDLFVLNTLTDEVIKIGEFGLANNPPTWTLDGRFLEFDTYDDGFYLYDLQASNLDHILASSQYSDGSAISPSGDRIAYKGDCEDGGCPDDLYVINTDGSGEQKLEDGAIQNIVWHPNGEQLYIVVREAAYNLYLYNIPTGAFSLIDEAIAYTGPSYVSPNGEFFAYSSSGNDLVILRTADNSRLPFEITGTAWPTWSPDSRFIAYTAEGGDLHFIELATGEELVIASVTTGGSIQAWLP